MKEEIIEAVKLNGIYIEFPPPGKLARTPVRRSSYARKRRVPSQTWKRSIQAESGIESSFYLRIDLDPTVKFIYEQPAKFYYLLDGRITVHYPDVLVIWKSGKKTFIEIKSINDKEIEFAYKRCEILLPLLNKLGYGYEVITSEEIYKEPQYSNAKLLRRLGKVALTDSDKYFITSLLGKKGPLTWGEIKNGALGQYGLQMAARMLCDGLLSFDSTLPLTDQSLITLTAGSLKGTI